MGGFGRALRVAMLTGVGVLVAFHGWLLAQRLADGQLFEPGVALRWSAAVLLVASLDALRRRGVPLLRGRKALGFWALVVLLHWSATPAAERGLAAPELLVVAPASVVTLLAGVVLLLGAASRARSVAAPDRPAAVRVQAHPVASAVQQLLPVLGARPPPA